MTRFVAVRFWRVLLFVSALIVSAATLRAQTSVPSATRRSPEFSQARRGQALTLRSARQQQAAMATMASGTNLSTTWTSIGPAQVLTQLFGAVTGRVTSLVLDPADASGNTLYVGTTGGGVWKSTNAAGSSPTFTPLTDTLPVFDASSAQAAVPSLSIGALAMANGVLLAGTGDTNDATDSYYGAGLLRSADNGLTWTLVQQTSDGRYGNTSFVGAGFAGLAFSAATPSLAVAAVAQAAEGVLVNEQAGSALGLFYSTDAGITWKTATVTDGAQVEQTAGGTGAQGATAVVWNGARRRFYAAVQYHGYYESLDGANWTRLPSQPGAGLTLAACPTNGATASCPIFRGALAVQPVTGDMFALTVSATNGDTGLYQDACLLSGSGCGSNVVLWGTKLNSTPLESAGATIAQGDYNLTLAAAPVGTDTVLYAGTIDLYRCTLASGCALRNTTNASNGCLNRAGVFPAQHALTALGSLLFAGNDGGLWRSTDAVAQTGSPCSLSDASHFDNSNGGFGSLAEVASFAQDPVLSGTVLAGFGALGSAGTASAASPSAGTASAWPQLATGEGGMVAIDAVTPGNWTLTTSAGVNLARCTKGSGCAPGDFAASVTPRQVASEPAAIHSAYLLDPATPTEMLVGTCRVWRGPVQGGALWSSSNAIAAPFATPAATSCSSGAPVVRSLGAGGPVSSANAAQNAGSTVLYAGMAGTLTGGGSLGGHVFATTHADVARNTTVWTDLASSTVTNDKSNNGVFNPGGFDISSIAVDVHDSTGATVYVTVLGFTANNVSAPRLYRSVDFGAHWLNVSGNLPNAPANSVVIDPNDANTVYIALDTGVYVTTSVTTCATMACWSVYGTALPNAPVVELLAAPAMATGDGRLGELRAGTYGRGLWQIPLVTAIAPSAPAITLAPSSLVFATQQSGTASAPQTVTVTNSGQAPLTVTSVTTSTDYSETDTCQAAAIAVGANCTVQVTFLPSVTGTRNGKLTVYGNVPGGQAQAQLTGDATAAAAVVLTPVALMFGSANVGSTSVAQNVSVANTGGTAVTLTSFVVSGDFVLSGNTCGATLGPSASCAVSIKFAPTASGSQTGSLTVTDSAGTQVANLSGKGTNPATDALAPLTLNFAAQQLTTASATQMVTLSNAGDVPLLSLSAQITAGDFTVTSGCGVSLAAKSTCSFAVAFVPRVLGMQTGTLTISDQYRTQTVMLSGIGIAPAGVSLAPLSGLQFGQVGVGLTAPGQTVTLTNNGGVTLAIDTIVAKGDFTIVPGSNGCGTSLAPSAVCSLQVVFTPVQGGKRTGTLSFSDSAANSPQTLALTGTGVDFTLNATGPVTQTVASGAVATYTLALGSAAGLAGTVPFTCSGLPVHAVCTVNPGTGALGGNSSVVVTVATGTTAALGPAMFPWLPRSGVWLAGLLPLLLGRNRRRVRARLAGLLLIGLAGCSTPRTQPGSGGQGGTIASPTPSGSYTLLVAGSSAGLVRSVSLTLVVQ